MSELRALRLVRRFGGVVALDGVSLEVAARQVLAIIGPNGSGKTTLLNALTGMERPDAGRIELDGREVSNWPAARLARRGVARTFQDGRLLEALDALDNVRLGLHAAGPLRASRGMTPGGARRRRERALATLAAVGLAELWDRPVRTLSHGQRRRVELARALAARPGVLALDEPTAGLTAEDTAAVAQLVVGARDRGAALLLVEHDLDVVGRVADTVLVLDAGAVVTAGAPAEVLADVRVRHLLGVAETAVEVPA